MVWNRGGPRPRASRALLVLSILVLSPLALVAGPGSAAPLSNTIPDIVLPPFHDAANETYFGKEDTRFFKVPPLNNRTDIWTATATDAQDDVIFWRFDWLDRPGVQTPPGMVIDTPSPPVRASDTHFNIHWVPGYEQAGVYTFQVDASDGRLNARTTFTVVVENTNRRPVFDAVSDQVVLEGQELLLALYARDADLNDPTYPDHVNSVASGVPPGAQFQDGHRGLSTFIWRPHHGQAGVHEITVRANDYDPAGPDITVPEGPQTPLEPTLESDFVDPPVRPVLPARYNATTSFHVTVIDVNQRPECARPPDAELRYGMTFHIEVKCIDPDADPLAMTASPLPAGAVFQDHGEGYGVLQWTPTLAQVGTYTVTFTAHDGQYGTTTEVRLVVHEFDIPPVFLPIAHIPIVETAPFALFVHTVDGDGDAISLSAPILPAGAVFDDLGNGKGRLTWTPPIGSIGQHAVRFQAESNGVERTLNHTIRVVNGFAFTLGTIGGNTVRVAPDTEIMLPVQLQNTGYITDTYHFRAYVGTAPGHGWQIVTPDPVTLGPGQATIVYVPVSVPEDGIFARPRLIAESGARPTINAMLTHKVDVPVILHINLNLTAVTMADLAILEGVPGQVVARWIDGRPAEGLRIVVRQQHTLVPELGSEKSGVSNEGGAMEFKFDLDPIAVLPGRHQMIATAHREQRTDMATVYYSVQVQ